MKNERPDFDPIITQIADYALSDLSPSPLAIETATAVLMDSMACALQALHFPDCTRLLGPVVPSATLEYGARVIGSPHELDPVQAAFNNGLLIRWLDFNDTWLAAEWGHPSDNLGGILSLMDYLTRVENQSFNTKDLLHATIKAHEIQGVLALSNSFNQVGLDHVVLVKVATTAVSCHLLQLDHSSTCNALSHAWLDGQALRAYRHAPNTGPRKSWAAGDASSRGVRLALLARKGVTGYPSALSADIWGFETVCMKGKKITLSQPLGYYVMENILFKIAFPAEFHGQTAVEAGIILHARYKDQLDTIASIQIKTQESAVRIINKKGPLNNPADRDHSLQYMLAVALLEGELNASHYENSYHQATPRIDELRQLMSVTEDPSYTADYLDPKQRAIPNAVQLTFKNGESSDWVEIKYPIGHRERREEGKPVLREKINQAISRFTGIDDPNSLQEKLYAMLKQTETPLEHYLDALFTLAKNPN